MCCTYSPGSPIFKRLDISQREQVNYLENVANAGELIIAQVNTFQVGFVGKEIILDLAQFIVREVGNLECRVGVKGVAGNSVDLIVTGEDKLQVGRVFECILWDDLDIIVVDIQQLKIFEALELER